MNEKHLSDIVRGFIKQDITDDFEDIENILSCVKQFDWFEKPYINIKTSSWLDVPFSHFKIFLGDLQKCSCGDWNDSDSMIENKQGEYGSYICLSCAEDL